MPLPLARPAGPEPTWGEDLQLVLSFELRTSVKWYSKRPHGTASTHAAHDTVDGAGDVASTATGHMQELVA